MWSHYANRDTGICIEYSVESLFENDLILRLLHPVVYKPERFDLTEHFGTADPGGTNVLAVSLASCHKAPDWSYEREWRLVIPGRMASQNPNSLSTSDHRAFSLERKLSRPK